MFKFILAFIFVNEYYLNFGYSFVRFPMQHAHRLAFESSCSNEEEPINTKKVGITNTSSAAEHKNILSR